MSDRNWYAQGREHEPGFIARGVGYDTTMYRDIVAREELIGTDVSILRGIVLLEVVEAAEAWFEKTPEEPYSDAPMMLSIEEANIVAAAENRWYAIPGNTDLQEKKWHAEYQKRMGGALTTLAASGYEASGKSSRNKWKFQLQASHPSLRGELGMDKVWEAFDRAGSERAQHFNYEKSNGGLVVVRYNSCPPGGNFEPVIHALSQIV